MENVPYANAIGTIVYPMISTRPNITHSISLLSRYMSNPKKSYWDALKYLLRYINGSVNCGLCYKRRYDNLDLVRYVDSDFVGDKDSRKSNTAYFFTLGGNCISWKSQLQPLIALSSTETKYVAIIDAFKEAIWLQGLLREINLLQIKVVVLSDSQSAIHLCKNPVYHERSRHIEVKYHFVQELVTNGTVMIKRVSIEDNPADMGTKTLTAVKFKHCLSLLHIEVEIVVGEPSKRCHLDWRAISGTSAVHMNG
ncbi:secreted RxLR effector protein 161-like [Diospyros lotus]|uniref:secreted RxLR effector protein 161-like n=1 Tax=Diospyros lotus TaxID=55363 RepID=UPI0022564A22|nr:secreted RxLR effector protein 161-like [Diospyros lotus]